VTWLVKSIGALVMFSALMAAGPLRAVQPDEVLSNPVLEARARTLSKELRCMVCQNQSIDDSEAPLARDLRLLVRERIAAGDSDGQVLNFLVVRYGEFVLLKPRLEPRTWLLWLLSPLALAGGGLVLWVQGRRRSRSATGQDNSTVKLTAEEEARLKELIAEPSLPDRPA
jgi:cytochrome c-type biogenesis protein CcmH